MPARPPMMDYVSWTDVHETTRYLELGYGGRFKFVMVVACPAGEQHLKQYWELLWCNDALETRPLRQRLLVQFPGNGSKSLAAAFLGLLYKADELLAETHGWTEPEYAAKPRRDLNSR